MKISLFHESNYYEYNQSIVQVWKGDYYMLVELVGSKGPFLVEIRKAAPDITLFRGTETGKTLLESGSYTTREAWTIDLSYEEFRWALAVSVVNREPYLVLSEENMEAIRTAYAQAARTPPTKCYTY